VRLEPFFYVLDKVFVDDGIRVARFQRGDQLENFMALH
jgi:hypothetical protein